jgi:DNA/RNA endonuclease YhcR with UshA esterase domain
MSAAMVRFAVRLISRRRLKNLIADWPRRVSNAGMKLFLPILVVLSLTSGPALAEPTNAAAPAKIGTADADKHYDQEMIVTGKVVQVTLKPTIIFINLDQPHPDSPFVAVIHSDATNQFGDLESLKGKSVEIQGKIKEYRDKPEIILRSASQLKVLDAPVSTNAPATK